MSDTAIEVENVSKLYHIGARQSYKTARDTVAELATRPLRLAQRWAGLAPAIDETATQLWALKDVSFTVNRGQVVGIIGRNGAGKSTLLKVLSRITEPTSGRIKIHGRVGSLLEVGTGFHPELTGRENVFLNGAILGMKRSEIVGKFDEIVAFAEIEKFIDTPVKHYSSGMYMRLAFAVAAHLEPEILIVDEVLAVGDAEFQKKCLGKMKSVAGEGRTVLFVSHNMNAVQELCTVAIHLDAGVIRQQGPAIQIVNRYLFDATESGLRTSWTGAGNGSVSSLLTPRYFALVDADGRPAPPSIRNDADYWIVADVDVTGSDPALNIGYTVLAEDGQTIFWSFIHDAPESAWPVLALSRKRLKTKWPTRLLNEGTYCIELLAALHNRQWILESGRNAPSINVTIQGGLSDSPHFFSKRQGLLAPVIAWEAAD